MISPMPKNNHHIVGLSSNQVLEAREKFGTNQLNYKKENGFWDALKSLIKEPMLILLLVAASVYFISGDAGDGFFMVFAIVLVAAKVERVIKFSERLILNGFFEIEGCYVG